MFCQPNEKTYSQHKRAKKLEKKKQNIFKNGNCSRGNNCFDEQINRKNKEKKTKKNVFEKFNFPQMKNFFVFFM